MTTVVIDQQDAIRCIKQWDSPHTLFYVDAPYVDAEDMYAAKFSDHEQLADVLAGIQGKAVVSYYDHPRVLKLYPSSRWQIARFKARCTACGTKGRSAESVERTELVITNFDHKTRRRLVDG